ncbi:survival motor neuron protein-like [Antennarius striatus]|uniref:survival motor neuron protein-like n=1 Tax=Antennarius striatus TaxID=241820 RepID=UPI0035B3F337
MTEETDFHVSTEPESAENEEEETSLVETLHKTLEITEDFSLLTWAESEEEDDKEKLEPTEQQDVSPPALEFVRTEPEWEEGAECVAVWAEDGKLYPAKVVSVEGDHCRVRFHDYGNEEEVELSVLKTPAESSQVTFTRQPATISASRHLVSVIVSLCFQEWRPGCRCRAVYSEDGLVYPAVVLWVEGQRCGVRFDIYNNMEEHDVSSLLSPSELHGNSRATRPKDHRWKSVATSGAAADGRRSRGENHGEQGRERRRGVHQSPPMDKENPSQEKKKDAEKPTNHGIPFFPQFPPQLNPGDNVPFMPLPPPLQSSDGVGATTSMMMLWYICGFHTGSYMAQQESKSSQKP